MRFALKKPIIAATHDILMAPVALALAYWLRLGETLTLTYPFFSEALVFVTLTATFTFLSFRVYRRSWRYVSLRDGALLARTVTVTTLLLLLIMFAHHRLESMPRSVPIIFWLVYLPLTMGPRILYRFYAEGNLRSLSANRVGIRRIPVLLVGLNDHSEHFLRGATENPHSQYRIVGMLDEDHSRRGQYIRGIRVFGTLDEAESILQKLIRKGTSPQKIIIPPDAMEGEKVRALLNLAEKYGMNMARLPRITDFTENTTEEHIPLRPIAIEDLLHRPQRTLELEDVRSHLHQKTILITGAGGSIGSELAHQIATYQPAHLLLLDHSEHSLYQIDRLCRESFPELNITPLLADIRDIDHLRVLFADYRPQIVYHAAAIKHVPLAEEHVCETVRTNVLGTLNVLEQSAANKVMQCVLVSTDKAVNPTNVMGASKRTAEILLTKFSKLRKTKDLQCVTVRFGNVLGSSGSVIPLFREQIEKGGPVTITHPEITRFFMTIREAVTLVLKSSALAAAHPEQHAPIYVLEMGEPVKITDMAREMIRLSGRVPDTDITLNFTGLRPGEKLHEELFYTAEFHEPTPCPGILLAQHMENHSEATLRQIQQLTHIANGYDTEDCLEVLKRIVPEFQPGTAS